VPALCSMCTRENEARTQAKAALALGALCSNYASTLNDGEVYVDQEAQSEALGQGVISLLVPILTSWQPDAQAAASEALANLAFQVRPPGLFRVLRSRVQGLARQPCLPGSPPQPGF
jgi:hypothetical protein